MAKRKRNNMDIQAQKKGKERDLQTCQVCGSSHKPNGHHIIDVQYGGSSNVDNIVTLCDRHHKKVHSGKLSVTKF